MNAKEEMMMGVVAKNGIGPSQHSLSPIKTK